MKILYLITIVLFSFSALAEHCDFEAEVFPKKLHEETKKIYQETCNWFYESFDQYPLLPLTKIEYIDFLENTTVIENDTDVPIENLEAIYCCKKQSSKNEIYINTHYLTENEELYNQSVLAHEIIHFLVKSANFERLIASESWENVGMHEALAYWGQNKFLERHSENNLMDYLNMSEKNPKVLTVFDTSASIFYYVAFEDFIYGSIHFFDADTNIRYNKLIDNMFYTDIFSSEVEQASRPSEHTRIKLKTPE